MFEPGSPKVLVLLGLSVLLASSGSAEASVRSSLQGLLHGDWQVRQRSARRLKRAGRAALPGLLDWLHKGSTKQRLAASYGLSCMGRRVLASKQSQLLKRLKRERHAGVLQYLIQAMERLRRPPRAFFRRMEAWALGHRDPGVRMAALKALGRSKRGLLRVLGKKLRSRRWRERRAAARMLGRVWSLALLRKALGDGVTRVRAAAAVAAGRWRARARPLIPTLKRMLRARSWRLRYAAAQSFRLMRGHARPAMKALAAVLGDGNWGVRFASSHALARIGRPALPLLRRAYRKGSARQRLAVIDTLLRMKKRHSRRPDLRLLMRGLRDRSWLVRFASVRAVRAAGGRAQRAVGAVARLLRDGDWRIREAAALTLARLSLRKPHWRALRRCRLNDPQPAVREAALKALAQRRNPRRTRDLRAALKDRHWLIQKRAKQALGSAGK